MANANALVLWMRDQLAIAGSSGFVVGLSGGLDSAVVARLAQLAAPGAVVGAILPCHSDPQDEADAAFVANHFSMPTVHLDLSAPYELLIADAQAALHSLPDQTNDASPSDPVTTRGALTSVKPRLRMTTLYFLADSLGYLVAGTSNRSELAVGYFTKHGDGAADLLPIGQLVKSEVRDLARELGVPRAVIGRTPSAGLWIGQSDEEDLGFTYDELERYLEEGPQGVSPALAMRIERLIRSTEHKRQLPPMPDPD